jgi:drug/metabolite transporter (DMT)-like permease
VSYIFVACNVQKINIGFGSPTPAYVNIALATTIITYYTMMLSSAILSIYYLFSDRHLFLIDVVLQAMLLLVFLGVVATGYLYFFDQRKFGSDIIFALPLSVGFVLWTLS